MYIFRRYITISLPSGKKKDGVQKDENNAGKQNTDYTDYEEFK